jgi:hypothetical protein
VAVVVNVFSLILFGFGCIYQPKRFRVPPSRGFQDPRAEPATSGEEKGSFGHPLIYGLRASFVPRKPQQPPATVS